MSVLSKLAATTTVAAVVLSFSWWCYKMGRESEMAKRTTQWEIATPKLTTDKACQADISCDRHKGCWDDISESIDSLSIEGIHTYPGKAQIIVCKEHPITFGFYEDASSDEPPGSSPRFIVDSNWIETGPYGEKHSLTDNFYTDYFESETPPRYPSFKSLDEKVQSTYDRTPPIQVIEAAPTITTNKEKMDVASINATQGQCTIKENVIRQAENILSPIKTDAGPTYKDVVFADFRVRITEEGETSESSEDDEYDFDIRECDNSVSDTDSYLAQSMEAKTQTVNRASGIGVGDKWTGDIWTCQDVDSWKDSKPTQEKKLPDYRMSAEGESAWTACFVTDNKDRDIFECLPTNSFYTLKEEKAQNEPLFKISVEYAQSEYTISAQAKHPGSNDQSFKSAETQTTPLLDPVVAFLERCAAQGDTPSKPPRRRSPRADMLNMDFVESPIPAERSLNRKGYHW